MKIVVKTLKGTRFVIQVNPNDSVADVKKNIETVVGASEYPAAEQTLIHKGKILKDETTMEANNVAEKSSIAIMKRKPAPTGSFTASVGRNSQAKVAPAFSTRPSITRALPSSVAKSHRRATATKSPARSDLTPLPPGVPASVSPSYMVEKTTSTESSIQQILEICGGKWTRDMVASALLAANYNHYRAVEYLYSGVPVLSANPSDEGIQEQHTQKAAAPEAAERKVFYYFPEGLPNDGSLEFLRHTQQFRALRPLVRSRPNLLTAILKVIKKQNPPLLKMILENKAGFRSVLKDEPVEGGAGGNQMAQPQQQVQDEFWNHITREEYESIKRLEAMGFERILVVEVYLACNKNEELAASFLLDHSILVDNP